MRRLLLVLAVAVVPLAVAGAAAAEQPATTTITVDTTFTNPVMSAFCGFPVQQSAVGEIRVTTFADGRVVQHRDLTIAQSANGVTIVATHPVTFFLANGERTSAGLALFDLPDGRKLAADVADRRPRHASGAVRRRSPRRPRRPHSRAGDASLPVPLSAVRLKRRRGTEAASFSGEVWTDGRGFATVRLPAAAAAMEAFECEVVALGGVPARGQLRAGGRPVHRRDG